MSRKALLAELDRSIAISHNMLATLGAPPRARPAMHPQASSVLTSIAAVGLPKLPSRRLPEALATQLHALTETHFRQACLSLLDTHSGADIHKLHDVAMRLKATFTSLYEKKLIEASSRQRPHFSEKQPFSTDILLYAFEQSPSPTRRERQVLSSLTGLTLEQVRVWFQNRRQRMKKRAPELQSRTNLQLDDLLERVAAHRKAADEDFDDNDSGYCSDSDRDRTGTPAAIGNRPIALCAPAATLRSYPAPYAPRELSTEFSCDPPVYARIASSYPPTQVLVATVPELTLSMSRLTLRHRRETPRSSTGSAMSAISITTTAKSAVKGKKAVSSADPPNGDAPTRKKAARKDPETGRKVAGRRTASAASAASPALSSSTSPPPAPAAPCVSTDAPTVPRKRLGPLRRKPAGKALARQASESSVASTSSSDSSRSTSYSSDFSFASDSSFTSVESVPTAASMECFQPQQQPQFDPLAAFDFTQLFSSQPSDILPQPVADFELPPDLLAGLQMPMDAAALPPPESTDFLALLNDPTIQDLLQSVQDMDVVAPQQAEQSFTFNNTLDVGSVDTSAFLDLSASTLPTFDAMFGLDASSFQDTLWNSPGFSLPITV